VSRLNLSFLTCFFITFSSIPVYAVDCYSDSPGKKDASYETPVTVPKTISTSQIKNANALFKGFNGKWVGDAVYVFCKGDRSSFKEQNSGFRLEGKVESKKNELVINVDLSSTNTNKTLNKKLSMYITDKFLRHNHKGKKGDIHIISADKNKIHYVKKHPGSAGLEEKTVVLRKLKSEFVLEQRNFVRGELASKELWVFRK